MSNPLVSVVIPVFNGVNYLREAIDSVLAQTYANIELVVVDDGSKDSTWDIIESYGSKVRGIHKENGGVGSALNWGITNAQGVYIAWLSHDDVFFSTKIECQINFLIMHPEYEACYTDFVVVDVLGKLIHTYHLPWYPKKDIPRQFLRNMYINGSTTLIKKSLFSRAGRFNENLFFTQDMDMWIRISEYSDFGHIPQVLLMSRSHPEQGSWDFKSHIIEERSYFMDMFQRMGPLKIFPELSHLSNETKQTAAGFELLGDETYKYRRWYSFAQKQYQQSYLMSPSVRTRFKSTFAKIIVELIGSENDSLLLVKRARFLLNQGDRQTARKLCVEMFLKHPLRLDALLIWSSAFVPQRIYQWVRYIKRSMLNLLREKK